MTNMAMISSLINYWSHRFSIKGKLSFLVIIVLLQVVAGSADAQMRKIYLDNLDDYPIEKISFYTPSQGYVAATSWLGFTADSGRTFTKKYIGNNVTYNNFPVDLSFDFLISGVKAFNQDTVLVYGHTSGVPVILYSNDKAITFTMVHRSQGTEYGLHGGVEDMVFPANRNIGYAVEADRIVKTTNGGKNWLEVLYNPNSYYAFVEAIDDNTVIAFSTDHTKKPIRTTNGGVTWQEMSTPAGGISYVYFITANKGWINTDNDGIYYTANGGASWTLKNNFNGASFHTSKMKFVNDSIGYAIDDVSIYKTTDSGRIWEPLPKDNNENYHYADLHFWSKDQFWAGGNHGFLELTTNAGGTPLPRAFFSFDSTNLSTTGTVNLINYSKAGYQYKWYINGLLVSSDYNASYLRTVSRSADTMKLVVINGAHTDTAIKHVYFGIPPSVPVPVISSFTPVKAGAGGVVTITGTNFTGATAVTFGDVPASSFIVQSATSIRAVVGQGASGKVKVTNPYGTAEANGFSFIPAPIVTSFTPAAGYNGVTITITGANFTGATAVSFGGIPATSFTIVSDVIITAIPGAGASGNVLVTTPGGTAGAPGFTFNYPPVITDFSPSLVTTGTVVTIEGTNFLNASSVDFGTTPALSFTINSDTRITAVVGNINAREGLVYITTPYGRGRSAFTFNYGRAPRISNFSPQHAGNGTRIRIYGDELAYVTSVSFGGVPAESIIHDGPDLIAYVGAGASGDVVVTSALGTASAPGFRWHPVPVVSAISPTTGRAGTEVTITGQYFDSVASVKFGTVKAVSWKVVSNTEIKAIVGNGVSGPVSVITPGGADTGDVFTFIPSVAPVITAVVPAAAPAGTLVTITGSNFNPSAGGNVVYFGAVKAIVTGATANSLQVIVPVGATYDYITVTSFNLTASTKLQFTVVPPVLAGITPTAFTQLPATAIESFTTDGNVLIKDMDGDGKPDILKANWKGAVAVRNTSNNGVISFAPVTHFAFVDFCDGLDVGDLDGDGRPEAVFYKSVTDSLIILRNNSAPGYFSFDSSVRLAPGYNDVLSVNITDLNLDGKPDIYMPSSYAFDIYIMKNTTQGGSIAFRSESNIKLILGLDVAKHADLDGDGKPELIVAYGGNSVAERKLGYLRNTSTQETISFARLQDIVVGNVRPEFDLGDVDMDGKVDIIMSNGTGFSVFRNTSADTGISLQRIDFEQPQGFSRISGIADIDGDGKPELILNRGGDSICIFKNVSSPGNLAFVKTVAFVTAGGTSNSIVGDLNGDHKPEITVAIAPGGTYLRMVAILQNQSSGGSSMVQVCSGQEILLSNASKGVLYQWQMDTGSGFNNINNNGNVLGAQAAILQLNNVPASWNNYQFRCLTDGNAGNVFKLTMNASVVPAVTITGGRLISPGQSVTVSATIVNGGTSPVYQWQDSTANHSWANIAGAVASTLTYAPTVTGNKLRIILTSNAYCANPSTIISAPVTFTVSNIPTAINPVPAADYGIRLYPNPVTDVLMIDSLKLSDQWQTLEIVNIAGKKEKVLDIRNQTKLSLAAEHLSKGMYLAILRKKNGQAVYLKFVKL